MNSPSPLAYYLREQLMSTSARSFRISQGLIGLCCVWLFSESFTYAPVFPLEKWQVPSPRYSFSLFNIQPSLEWTYICLSFFLASAVLFTLNVRPRLTAALTLLGTLSHYASANDLVTGGDVLINIYLIFFLTIRPEKGPVVRDIGVLLMKLQLALIYLFSVAAKSGDRYWSIRESVQINLRAFLWETPLGQVFGYGIPIEYQRLLCEIVLWTEFLIPFLIFFPFFHRAVGLVTFLLIFGLHVGMGAMMYLGTFSPAMIAYGALLLPLAPKAKELAPPLRITLPRLAAVLMLVAITLEVYDAQIGRPGKGPFIRYPLRSTFVQAFGFNQHWGMFTSKEVEIVDEVRTGNLVFILKDEEGRHFNPAGDENYEWATEFVTSQGRRSAFRKLLMASARFPEEEKGTRFSEEEQKREAFRYYYRLARYYAWKSPRPVKWVYVYSARTKFKRAVNEFPENVMFYLRATIHFDKNRQPTHHWFRKDWDRRFNVNLDLEKAGIKEEVIWLRRLFGQEPLPDESR